MRLCCRQLIVIDQLEVVFTMQLRSCIHCVLIKGAVLISETVLYTSLCSWDHA